MIRLDRTIPFVRAALDGTPAEAAAILQDAERRHGLRWLADPENRPEDNRDEWYRGHLWPFLSDTHMVLAAGDLAATGCMLLDTASVDRFPTWRHWGEIVAGGPTASGFRGPPALAGRDGIERSAAGITSTSTTTLTCRA